MNKSKISNLIRSLGLIYPADCIRFQIIRAKNHLKNKEYQKSNPSINFPPDYILYESFAIDYRAYIEGGRTTANDLFELLTKYISKEDLKILDWGCGPGRIIRHLPNLFGPNCSFFGTDYNSKSIKWCSKNIPNINFSKNNLLPPLNFENNQFDIIYGISIFTHLSKDNHHSWINELHRVLKKGGILLLTSAGNSFRSKLTTKEKLRFDNGELIVRARAKEGHRTFTTFHPVSFMQILFTDFEILKHIEIKPSGRNIPQDIWILKK